MLPGALSAVRTATSETQEIADQVKAQLEAQTNQQYTTFEVVSYRSQVVAGTNYFVKARVGPGERDYVHLLVSQDLPVYGGQVKLVDFQVDKTLEDPITYF